MAKKRYKSVVTICDREIVDLISFKRTKMGGWAHKVARDERRRHPASAKCKTKTFFHNTLGAFDDKDWNRALSKAIRGLVKY